MVSLNIFNILVDAVVRAALLEVCGPQDAHHGFGWVAGEHKIFFYSDDGWISGRNPIWVQIALTAIVRMFDRVGLQKNLRNTKARGSLWDSTRDWQNDRFLYSKNTALGMPDESFLSSTRSRFSTPICKSVCIQFIISGGDAPSVLDPMKIGSNKPPTPPFGWFVRSGF